MKTKNNLISLTYKKNNQNYHFVSYAPMIKKQKRKPQMRKQTPKKALSLIILEYERAEPTTLVLYSKKRASLWFNLVMI